MRKFELGQVVVTPGVIEKISEDEQLVALNRHATGDWGEILSEGDKLANEEAIRFNLRIFSVYRSSQGVLFWIITEADRSATTLLLPEEY